MPNPQQKNRFMSPRNFFILIVTALLGLLIFSSYYAIQQKQIEESRALTNYDVCAEGEILDEETGECMGGDLCADGISAPDPVTGECPIEEEILAESPCADGVSVPDPTTGECVSVGEESEGVEGAVGTVTLALNLKFQGITGPTLSEDSSMDVSVTLSGEQLPNDLESTATFTNDESGIWNGEVSFDEVTAGVGYTVFVKGPKHSQMQICDAVPTEAAAGTYRCGDGNIELDLYSSNNFDFSGIVLLAGDLDPQDEIVDSYDISLVINNLGSREPEILAVADINHDGIVDTQDQSLIVAALSAITGE